MGTGEGIRILHHAVRMEDARGEDGAAGLRCSVGCPHHGEDDGCCTANRAEERLEGLVSLLRPLSFRCPGERN